jgi:putative tricarboxylic transport membrane protein
MKKLFYCNCMCLLLLSVFLMGPVTSSVHAASIPEDVHFLIPGGAGGGWDGTARGVGKALAD